MAKQVEPTIKYNSGVVTLTFPVDIGEGTMSESGKSLNIGGAFFRDVNVDGEMVRISCNAYVPLKAKKAAAAKDGKVRMTLAEARKAAAKAAD